MKHDRIKYKRLVFFLTIETVKILPYICRMIAIGSIKANPNNPRVTKNDKFEKLKNSIKEFPKMMSLRPMILDSNGMVLGGNHRLRALQDLGFKEIPDNWVKYADELTEEEKERFIITDNLSAADWDYELLQSAWDAEKLEEWGVDLPEWGEEEAGDKSSGMSVNKLTVTFDDEVLYLQVIDALDKINENHVLALTKVLKL